MPPFKQGCKRHPLLSNKIHSDMIQVKKKLIFHRKKNITISALRAATTIIHSFLNKLHPVYLEYVSFNNIDN